MRRTLHAFALAACFLALTGACAKTAQAAQAEGKPIGLVIAVSGEAFAERSGGRVPLALKTPIMESDTLITGTGARLQVLLDDESSLTIGADSSLEMSEFVNAGDAPCFGARLGQGILRIITGTITEANPEGFKITTPLATIGIRGTILVVDATDRHTTVRVVSSERAVVVNGTEVAQFFKITINKDGDYEVAPLTREDLQEELDAATPAFSGTGRSEPASFTTATPTRGRTPAS
jgi:hypothetical protein